MSRCRALSKAWEVEAAVTFEAEPLECDLWVGVAVTDDEMGLGRERS